MTRLLAIFVFIFAAGPVFALSCMRPDVARSFQTAHDASETYLVVKGELRFDERLLPERDLTGQNAKDVEIPARFEGQALSRSGFETQFAQNITLLLRCFGPWCAEVASGKTYLAFLEHRNGNYVMSADPCSSLVFLDPTVKQIRQAEHCIAGKVCKPKGF